MRKKYSFTQSYPHYPHFWGKICGEKKKKNETNVLLFFSKMGVLKVGFIVQDSNPNIKKLSKYSEN
jgi:hypothetical protein